MKKLLTFFIVIGLVANMSLPVTAAGTDGKYLTDICKIPLSEALKEKIKNENSDTPIDKSELIPYVEKEGILTILLPTALKNIEYTNPKILLNDRKIKLYKKQYFGALDDAMEATAYDSATDTNLKKRELLDWRVKLNNFQNAQYDRNEFVNNIKSELEKNYINALQLQKDKETADKDIQKLEQTIKQAEIKLKLELIKDSEMQNLNSTKSQLEMQFKSTERQLEETLLKIKQSLGLDINKKIELVPVNKEFVRYNDSKIKEKIKTAAQASHDIELIKKDMDLKRLEYDIVTRFYEDDIPAEADSLEISIEELEDSINTTALDAEAALWSSYFSLKNLEDNIEIEKVNVQLAQKDLDNIKMKVEMDKATAVDALTADIALSKAKNKLQSAINEYMLAQESFIRELQVKE